VTIWSHCDYLVALKLFGDTIPHIKIMLWSYNLIYRHCRMQLLGATLGPTLSAGCPSSLNY